MLKKPKNLLRLIFAVGILSLCVLAANAQPKAPEKSDRKDSPQIRELSFSKTYPFQKEKNISVSSVVFNYVYEKLEPNASRNAYNEALRSIETYLVGLVSSQNSGTDADAMAKKEVQIEETTGGAHNQPQTRSIRKAVLNANNSKSFVVEIRYYKENIVTHPDGSRSTRKTLLKTERQTFALTGGGQSAHIEIRCNNSDAVELADELFSLN